MVYNHLKQIQKDKIFYLFDLPGYGHAQVSKALSKTWIDLMDVFFKTQSSNILMINIQDARHPGLDSDKAFQRYLSGFKFKTFLILNKIDKLKTQKEKAQLKKSKKIIIEEQVQFKEVHFVSAEKQTGVKELEQSLINIFLNKNALS